jgi:iron-sulfur cluster insertion protein
MDPTVTPAPDYQSLQRPLDFTAAAAAKVRELIAEEGNPALKLRVYIQGGGCSGFQYGFEFDEQQGEDDLAIATDDVTLLVDPLSLQYLMGAAVDYTESLHGAQFVIRNENANNTCGCGSSFTVLLRHRSPSSTARSIAPTTCATTPMRSRRCGRRRG